MYLRGDTPRCDIQCLAIMADGNPKMSAMSRTSETNVLLTSISCIKKMEASDAIADTEA